MSDVTRRNKRKTRRGCRRNNQIGGNLGAGYSVTPTPVAPNLPFIGNSARIDYNGNCRAQTPDYAITPPPARGLPGMGGGRRRYRRANRMRGGAYTFNLTQEPVGIGASLSQGGYPEVQKLGCQGTITNSLNMGPHTGSNPTPGAVNQWALGASIADSMNKVFKGGAAGVPTGVQNPVGTGSPYLDLAAVPGTPGGTGSPFLTSPTAGYANQPSSWRDSVGAPVELQIPYNARIMNPACIKTGGGKRKNTRRNRRNTRRNRKNRRNTRRTNRR